jgi:hypothetical protein
VLLRACSCCCPHHALGATGPLTSLGWSWVRGGVPAVHVACWRTGSWLDATCRVSLAVARTAVDVFAAALTVGSTGMYHMLH